MEEKKFYVAVTYDYSWPTIVESFADQSDAQTYADLMTRTKQQKYIVLVPVYESKEASRLSDSK